MKKLLLLAVLLIPMASAYASFEDVEKGARATAMGGALVASGDDINSIFYNPAGIGGIRRCQIMASQEALYMGLSDGSDISKSLLAFGTPILIDSKYVGTVALGWDYLGLSGLYGESKMMLDYATPMGNGWWGGVSLNRLSQNYGSDAYTALNPVFANGYEKSNFGFDVGILKVMSGINIGLSVQDLNQPDMGLKYVDKVDRKINFGVSLKRPTYIWDMAVAMIGNDIRFKTGTEAFLFKKFLQEKVLVRGGFNLGSRDYRNLGVGFGYRDNGYSIDYSFLYPLSGIDVSGSHQISLTFAFGKSYLPEIEKRSENRDSLSIGGSGSSSDESGKDAGKSSGNIGNGLTDEKIRQADELIAKARQDIAAGMYQNGYDKLVLSDKIVNNNQEIKEMIKRIGPIANIVSSVVSADDKGRLIRMSVNRFLKNETEALEFMTYAHQVWPDDVMLTNIREVFVQFLPDNAPNQKVLPGVSILDQWSQDSLDLIRSGKFVQAIGTLQKIIDIQPNNVNALTRMGSAYWVMGKKDLARKYWSKVLEVDPKNTDIKQFYNNK